MLYNILYNCIPDVSVCRCTVEIRGLLGCADREVRVGNCGSTSQILCCRR